MQFKPIRDLLLPYLLNEEEPAKEGPKFDFMKNLEMQQPPAPEASLTDDEESDMGTELLRLTKLAKQGQPLEVDPSLSDRIKQSPQFLEGLKGLQRLSKMKQSKQAKQPQPEDDVEQYFADIGKQAEKIMPGVEKAPGHRQETDPTKITQKIDTTSLADMIEDDEDIDITGKQENGEPYLSTKPKAKAAPKTTGQKVDTALSGMEIQERLGNILHEMRNAFSLVTSQMTKDKAYRALIAWCNNSITELNKLVTS